MPSSTNKWTTLKVTSGAASTTNTEYTHDDGTLNVHRHEWYTSAVRIDYELYDGSIGNASSGSLRLTHLSGTVSDPYDDAITDLLVIHKFGGLEAAFDSSNKPDRVLLQTSNSDQTVWSAGLDLMGGLGPTNSWHLGDAWADRFSCDHTWFDTTPFTSTINNAIYSMSISPSTANA